MIDHFLDWVKVIFFLWVYSFSPTLLLLLYSALPLPPSAQNSQFIQTQQVAQSLWEWSPGSSQMHRFQPPAPSARGASTASRGTLNLPVWTSTGRQTLGLLRATTAQSGSRWVLKLPLRYYWLWRGFYFNPSLLSRLIWRKQNASAASSLREPKTSAWCSSCLFSKLRTVTMGNRGIHWRRRMPATIRSGLWTHQNCCINQE